MRRVFAAAAVAALSLAASLPAASLADEANPAAKAADKDAKSANELPPFPADASVRQTATIRGVTYKYTATVGSLPVRDESGKKIAEIVFTAYTLDGPGSASRPVTFAFNGGPGAASVYLNMGAIGPKRVQFGAQGDAPSDSPVLHDNPGSWLPFTDLVFIDPVGTGYSRSLVGKEETKKAFFGAKQDINYLSRIVYDWLQKNGRMNSAKYLVGESYGGFRGPRLAETLQTDLGVGISGMVLVSPYLDGMSWAGGDFSPMPWAVTLPSMTAANYERQGKTLSPETMAGVEAYARGEFVTDFLKGRTDPAAEQRIMTKVGAFTGLDPRDVQAMGGRIDSTAFLRQLYKREGKIGSWYDSNVTAEDPFPWAADRRRGDPILDAIVAPTTSAAVDFTTRVVGWKVEGQYHALNGEVGQQWEDELPNLESVTALRKSLAVDPKMRVLIVHGYDDLSCPYFASRLVVDQMPPNLKGGRIDVHAYPGGHMFYSRPDSQASLTRDVAEVYGAAGSRTAP
jgi:carboxypeptidase C (cathepsin A)